MWVSAAPAAPHIRPFVPNLNLAQPPRKRKGADRVRASLTSIPLYSFPKYSIISGEVHSTGPMNFR
jgi:hypothetical protein